MRTGALPLLHPADVPQTVAWTETVSVTVVRHEGLAIAVRREPPASKEAIARTARTPINMDMYATTTPHPRSTMPS